MSSTARQMVVSGRVQGVGYRAWVAQEATARDLEGWVRNLRDGRRVEACFAGPADVVAGMIEACRRGPPLARIDGLSDEDAHPGALNQRRAGERFSVLPTI